MKKYIVVILSIALTSCSKNLNNDVYQYKSGICKTEIINQSLSKGTLNDSVLIENKVIHEFSQVENKDEFYICIKGKSILDGKTIFKITKSDGTELLNEEFPSSHLMDYGFEGDMNSVKEKEEYIKSRIKNFFNESNFIFPAIKTDETFDEDYSDKDIWNEIKSDLTTIGFSYQIGEEDGRKITFSKKKGKVVMYFNCC